MADPCVPAEGAGDGLKPCPFCAGEAWTITMLPERHGQKVLYEARCMECGAGRGGVGTLKLAAVSWNTRSTLDDAAALADARAQIRTMAMEAIGRDCGNELVEDGLRAQVAALKAENEAMRAAILWALGEGDSDFGDHRPDNAKPYWWRAELRKRAALAQSSGGEVE